VAVGRSAEPKPPRPTREKSTLGRALAHGTFAVVVEVAAPRGLELESTIEQARRFRDLGAMAVSVPDYRRAGARINALTLAGLLELHGVEALLHYTSRDRRLAAVQSDLVAAHALGVRNVLLDVVCRPFALLKEPVGEEAIECAVQLPRQHPVSIGVCKRLDKGPSMCAAVSEGEQDPVRQVLKGQEVHCVAAHAATLLTKCE
jgi:hypothetical protein